MRAIFWMIDDHATPIGGEKVIHQAAGALRRRGFDAYVASPAGVPRWLEGSPAVDDVAFVDTSASLAPAIRCLTVSRVSQRYLIRWGGAGSVTCRWSRPALTRGSSGRREGLGLPTLEAMAAGCVVCRFVGHGMMDFATRRNGLWVREGDVDGASA